MRMVNDWGWERRWGFFLHIPLVVSKSHLTNAFPRIWKRTYKGKPGITRGAVFGEDFILLSSMETSLLSFC
jgi:hypothetical protein